MTKSNTDNKENLSQEQLDKNSEIAIKEFLKQREIFIKRIHEAGTYSTEKLEKHVETIDIFINKLTSNN